MKILFVLIFVLLPCSLFALEDKSQVYKIENIAPEIKLAQPAPSNEDFNFWQLALMHTELEYASDRSFKQKLVGVSALRKNVMGLFGREGSFEMGFTFQRFSRTISYAGSNHDQSLNFYQLVFIQNIGPKGLDFKSYKNSWHWQTGVGIAPIYVTSETNLASNGKASVGAMGMLKTNLEVPFNLMLWNNKDEATLYNALDVSALFATGKAGHENIKSFTITLGIDFE